MPSSTILKLTDPYEYQAGMSRGTAADMSTVITGSGVYQSELTLVDLHDLGLQEGRLSLPRITRGATKTNLCAFDFATADNKAHGIFNGIEMLESHLAFFCPGAEHVGSASAGLRWAGMSLPPETLASASQALIGYEITAPSATQLMYIPPPRMARLQCLHRAAVQLAETAPDVLLHPEVARALEQELLRALIACFAEPVTINKSNSNRQRLLQKFHEVIEANQDEPLYLIELCTALGVTARTLNYLCTDFLGLSPRRYLFLRRMNLARRTLALADPKTKTVTSIANDYGFFELGRFAVAYRAMHGESPSATLRRAPS